MGALLSSTAETPTPDEEVTADSAVTTTEATPETSAEVEASVAVTDMTPSVSEDSVSTVAEEVTEASYATDDDSDKVSQPGVTEPATATVPTVPGISTTTETTPEKTEGESQETIITTDSPDVTLEITSSEAPASSSESVEDELTSASPSPSSSEQPESDEKEDSQSAETEPVSPSTAATTPSTTISTTTEVSPFPPFPGYVDTTSTTTTTPMTYGPGACVFNGKVYASAQQIPRDNPCDFCFCFRGDIICLQQSCPPPIPKCNEEAIPGFCCPRYECPVPQALVNITTTTTPIPTYPPIQQQVEVVMCEIGDRYYHQGQIVDEASGPCLECR